MPREKDYEGYGYEYIHYLLKTTRGRAAEYQCLDCTEQAHHWSLSAYAESPRIQIGTREAGRAYSENLEDYEPRCRKCHYAYDKKHGLMRGPDGNRSGRTRTSMMTRGVCGRDDCDRPHQAKGLCAPHYAQQRRKEQRDARIE